MFCRASSRFHWREDFGLTIFLPVAFEQGTPEEKMKVQTKLLESATKQANEDKVKLVRARARGIHFDASLF